MIHIDQIDGYQAFAHNPKAGDISDAVRNILVSKRTNIKVKLNPIQQDTVEETKFEERYTTYFEENFETLVAEAPLILPCKEPEKFKEIVKTMEEWCKKTNKSSSIKGLVLHSFSVFRHLEHFGFTRQALKKNFKIREFSDTPVIIVYNPQENVLLLIRTAEEKNLTTDIKLGLDDLKMFILLVNDKLKDSKMKLISLVVTDKEHDFEIKCLNCINNVVSLEILKDPTMFEIWWEEKATYFEKETVENINSGFINSFLAKVSGAVAAAFIYGKYIPTMTYKSDEQIENLAVLLTREQMEIVYSQHKHIIVRGGFECGKTVIAAAMLKKISESLKKDEKLYYVCYDSRSQLLDQMTIDVQKEDVTNVTPFHNEERRKLSEIIKDILEKNKSTKKMNFVVDEYDGEDLDESEAEKLNEIFNESLKETYILLIVQPIEKERIIDNIEQKRNRFKLLKNMKLYQLNRVMRNSVEIHNLVKLTTYVLQKQQTVFIHEQDNKVKSELVFFESMSKLLKVFSKRNATTKFSNPGSDITVKSPKKEIESQVYATQNFGIPTLGLDEAQAVSGSVKGTSRGGVKTIRKFRFAPADKTGHKISSKKPALFELGDRSNFQKVISLITILEERQIKRGEHVVLHFDTGTNEIPNIFRFAFTHHFNINEKITNKYEAFKSPGKSILVCSYPTFRRLEHPNFTVVIDRDVYYVQHYLVEALARCTSDLYVVVLQNSSTLTEVTKEWKKNQAIRQYEIEISDHSSQEHNFAFACDKNPLTVNAKFRREYYKKLEEKFADSVTEDKNLESKKELEARKIIQQR